MDHQKGKERLVSGPLSVGQIDDLIATLGLARDSLANNGAKHTARLNFSGGIPVVEIESPGIGRPVAADVARAPH